MIELSLILAIAILGLGLAGYLVRWVLARPLGDAEMNRIANTIRQACEGFMRRQSSTILALSGLATGLVFLAYGLRRDGTEAISRLETGVWLTVSCATGALSVILIGQVATFVATRATIRVASGARRSLDLALVVALRAGAVIGLVTTVLTTLGSAALVLAILIYHGALTDDPAGVATVSPSIPTFITGFALGAGFAALLSHVSGGVFAKSSDVGADIGGRALGLADDDRENPAAIANLVGDCVGECVGHSTTAIAAAVGEDLAVMMVGVGVFGANVDLRSALTIILLPILARSFGLLGAAFGVMIVRTDESEKPESALFRGFVVATVLHAVGFAGAIKWLLPRVFVEVAVCAGIGVALSFLLVPLLNQFTMVRARVRELAETARAGPALGVLGGLVAGLDAVIGPALVTSIAMVGSYAVGAHTDLASGGLFGVGVCMLGMVGASPYLVSVATASTMVDAACGIVVMSVGRDRPDVRGRLVVLDTVGTSLKALTRAHSAVLAAMGGLLLLEAFLRGNHQPATSSPLSSPLVFVGAILGVVLVLWVIARSTSGVTRCARRIVDEVRRQLVGRGQRGGGGEEDPKDRVDHASCIEIASRFALRYMILPGVGALVLPILAVALLSLISRPPFTSTVFDAVTALVLGGTVTALVCSIAIASLGGAWANARKYILTGAHGGRLVVDDAGSRTENPTFISASVGDNLGDALKDVGVPAAQILARLLPVIALILTPFIQP